MQTEKAAKIEEKAEDVIVQMEEVLQKENTEADGEKQAESLQSTMEKLLLGLQKSDVAEYVELYRHPGRLFVMNIWMGVGRGIGYLAGFAIGGTLLLYILNQLVDINLPLIGDFIAQVVKIVQQQLGQDVP